MNRIFLALIIALFSSSCLAAPAPPDEADKPDDAPPAESHKRTEYYQKQIENRERRLRRMMSNFGVEDEAAQNAIIAHIKADVETRSQLRAQVNRLHKALRDKDTPLDEIKKITDDYNAALKADKERRQNADKELDKAIGYSRQPRLEGTLLMFGIIGEGQMMIPGPPPKPNDRPRRGGRDDDEDDEPGQRRQQELIKRYDKDGDGRLDDTERAAVRADRKEEPRPDKPSDKPQPPQD